MGYTGPEKLEPYLMKRSTKDKKHPQARYGNQMDLLRDCIEILIDRGCAVPEGALLAVGMEVKEVA